MKEQLSRVQVRLQRQKELSLQQVKMLRSCMSLSASSPVSLPEPDVISSSVGDIWCIIFFLLAR